MCLQTGDGAVSLLRDQQRQIQPGRQERHRTGGRDWTGHHRVQYVRYVAFLLAGVIYRLNYAIVGRIFFLESIVFYPTAVRLNYWILISWTMSNSVFCMYRPLTPFSSVVFLQGRRWPPLTYQMCWETSATTSCAIQRITANTHLW